MGGRRHRLEASGPWLAATTSAPSVVTAHVLDPDPSAPGREDVVAEASPLPGPGAPLIRTRDG